MKDAPRKFPPLGGGAFRSLYQKKVDSNSPNQRRWCETTSHEDCEVHYSNHWLHHWDDPTKFALPQQ